MTASIVIPCFNHARYLPEAIESALAQRGAPVEVIVVDDGSTDGSGEVARRYRQVVTIAQANAGVSRARNAGLAAAHGDIMIFLDADDRLRPDAAAVACRHLSGHADAALVYGRCQAIDEVGRRLPAPQPTIDGDPYAELLRRNFIWTPAMAAFRRRLLDESGGFDPSVNPSADYDVYLRLARQHRVIGHETVVADYRRHGGNMSADPVLMLEMTLRVLRAQRRFVGDDPALQSAYAEGERAWHEFYGEQLVERFRSALHNGSRVAMLRDAWHLLRLYPAGVRRHLRRKAALELSGPDASRPPANNAVNNRDQRDAGSIGAQRP